MAMGPSLFGIAAYVGVKLAGYTYAGRVLGARYQQAEPKPFNFGVARCLLGVAVGFTFAQIAFFVDILNTDWLFFVLLFPFRMGEWLLIQAVYYPAARPNPRRPLKYALAGTAWSYALDIPAIGAIFVIPGGMWVC